MEAAPREPSSFAPAFLLSMPQLDDPNFRHTVVLLCQHSSEGAWGLVLNRPTGTPAVEAVRLDPPMQQDNGLELWVGGPVEPERGCILLGNDPRELLGDDTQSDDAAKVCDGLFISGSAALLRHLLGGDVPSRTRLFMGYAGWGPGQLDEELRESAWLVSEVQTDLIFDIEAGQMWETAIRRLGADPAALHMSPGVH